MFWIYLILHFKISHLDSFKNVFKKCTDAKLHCSCYNLSKWNLQFTMLLLTRDMRQRILEHHWRGFWDIGLSETSSMEWMRHWPTLTLAALFPHQMVFSLSTASPRWPAWWPIVSASVHLNLRGQLSWPAWWLTAAAIEQVRVQWSREDIGQHLS